MSLVLLIIYFYQAAQSMFVSKTGFLWVSLAILKLSLQTRLASNSQISTSLCLPKAGIKGCTIISQHVYSIVTLNHHSGFLSINQYKAVVGFVCLCVFVFYCLTLNLNETFSRHGKTHIPRTHRQRQEHQEFKSNLSFVRYLSLFSFTTHKKKNVMINETITKDLCVTVLMFGLTEVHFVTQFPKVRCNATCL